MQSDTKWMLGSLVASVIFIGLTAIFPALRVLVLLVIFVFVIALTYWAARPSAEE